ncbi:hypothetical protein PQE66_gp131 [Bacillus phage PBC2]|uniref:Uncharacterized protein n=1 Tax=Bacillus phage PBC2 TaxID=1675029 RepID=A0A218KC35_9CAUD|nr:hypothetical protein PQE66_gp131 [Bacillus phage PBC2]AKQ08446.1 hypothetical protein PBC2_131 [Bacillus phage PBC2]
MGLGNFKFMLKEELWKFEDDHYTVFEATLQEDGNYLVTWKTDMSEGKEPYESQLVYALVADGDWIIQQEEV